jgi:hypothetical protein
MVFDEHVSEEVDFGEIKVIFAGEDEGGTGGEKREIKRVEVFKRGRDPKEEIRANESGVGVGSPVEGGDGETDGFFNGVVHISGEDEKKHVIREERNNKHIYQEGPFVEGEGAEHRPVLGEAVESFGVRVGENPLKGHTSSDGNAKVDGLVCQGEIRPGAGGKEGSNGSVARGGKGADDAALGTVDTQPGGGRKIVDERESGGYRLQGFGGDSKIICKSKG